MNTRTHAYGMPGLFSDLFEILVDSFLYMLERPLNTIVSVLLGVGLSWPMFGGVDWMFMLKWVPIVILSTVMGMFGRDNHYAASLGCMYLSIFWLWFIAAGMV